MNAVAVVLLAGVDFLGQVQPILEKRCVACHGAKVQMNGLRMDQGPAGLKERLASGRVMERVTSKTKGFAMPPPEGGLSAAEIAILREWVGTAKLSTEPLWSLAPVRKRSGSIDSFVLARLAKEGVTASPEADRATLLRRVSLDLTGLPPAPAELDAFVEDKRPDAYERQVDRLLRSPHYGEKWARQWLDLAHYADSDGYEKDQPRAYAWRYRHWLIDALNKDMPFDQFTVEQLAGDLLPNATVEQRVATGFLRNTLTNREAGVDRDEARFEQLINRTNTVGTVWLGLGVGCAQCHNHKFDPILQRDYYSLFAFFDRTDEYDIDAPLPGELGGYLAALPEYEKKRKALLDEYQVPTLMPAWEAKMRMAIDTPGAQAEWDFALTSMKVMFDRTVRVLKTAPEQRDPRDQRRLENYFIQGQATTFALDKTKFDKIKELRPKLKALDDKLPPFTQAYVMRDDPSTPPTQVRVRGDWKNKGDRVEPNTLSALPPLKASGTPSRLDLARSLVSRENPLVARVFVNRAWQEFFGRGLVKTTEDFGKQGDRPTHPELLDWLAAEFMDNGWSVKALHKKIVMSASYRQSSKARMELETRDPENTLLARQSRVRLSAELVRDEALAASGLLNDEVGGRSVKPPQPAGIAELGYGGRKWEVSTGRDRYRRGLYIHFQRTTPFPMLMTFDSPDGSVACTRRARSNTALQALNLMNDEVFFEAAQALAWRLEREAPATITGKLDYAYRLCLGRSPTDRERDRLAQYHDEQARVSGEEGKGLSAWVGVSRVLLNLDEFVTRE